MGLGDDKLLSVVLREVAADRLLGHPEIGAKRVGHVRHDINATAGKCITRGVVATPSVEEHTNPEAME